MNSENLVIIFLILIGILYLIYQMMGTNKEKMWCDKNKKKVTFDLGNNKYNSYIIPSSITSNISNDTDMTYKVDLNNVTSIPNTHIELPIEYESYEPNSNVSLSQILKNTDDNISEYQTNICYGDSRYNGDLFDYNNNKSICNHISTTNEKVDIFRENNGLYVGQEIADVYDKITTSEYKKNKKEQTDKSQFYSYGDNGRKTMKPDRWEYKNEISMNGGAYKGDIYGYDPMIDKQLAI